MTANSDTPRTDAQTATINAACGIHKWIPRTLGVDLETELRAANERVKELEDALRELVECKELKTKMLTSSSLGIANAAEDAYRVRQPLAWAAARAALTKGRQQ